MRSQLFQRLDVSESERMRGDMDAIFALPSETLSKFIRRLPALQTARGRSADDALEQLGLEFSGFPLPRMISVLFFFGRHAMATDSSEDWADDMIELGLVDAEQRQRCLEVTNLVRTEFSTAEHKLRQVRQRAEDGVLPRFVNAAMTVELRAMFERDFSLRSDARDDYSPEVVGVVPILTLQVEVDSGEPDRFQMQFTLEDLRDLISILGAAEKQLEAVKAVSQSLNKIREA